MFELVPKRWGGGGSNDSTDEPRGKHVAHSDDRRTAPHKHPPSKRKAITRIGGVMAAAWVGRFDFFSVVLGPRRSYRLNDTIISELIKRASAPSSWPGAF